MQKKQLKYKEHVTDYKSKQIIGRRDILDKLIYLGLNFLFFVFSSVSIDVWSQRFFYRITVPH